jgi:hypothetical protein
MSRARTCRSAHWVPEEAATVEHPPTGSRAQVPDGVASNPARLLEANEVAALQARSNNSPIARSLVIWTKNSERRRKLAERF